MIDFPRGTANEFLHDRAIRHALYVERLKTAEVHRLIGYMNRNVLDDVAAELARRLVRISQRGFDLGPVTTRRLKDLLRAVGEVLGSGLSETRARFYKELAEIGAHEAAWQVRSLEEATGPLAMDFTTPSRAGIRSIITSRPMEGRILGDWWKGLTKGVQLGIEKQINLGVAQGETVDQMVRRITGSRSTRYGVGEFAALRRKTEALVRTSVNHINTHARELTYEANSDLMKGVQFVATLDARTTEICMSLDGQVFAVGEGPRPPLHWGCRSGTVPVLKSWKALGIPLAEAPAGTRASMDGQVPATMTYPEWLRKQPREVQDDALGPTRAAMFRSGKVSIDRFVDARNRPLSLEDIRRREGLTEEDIAIRRRDSA